MNRLGAA